MAERKNNVIDPPTDRALLLTRVFDAPRKLAFEACWRSILTSEKHTAAENTVDREIVVSRLTWNYREIYE